MRTPIRALLLAVLLTGGAARATEAGEGPRVAVVVGSNAGVEGDAPLEYAEEDARRVHQLLVEVGGVPAGNALLVTGANANAVRGALAEARRRLSALGPPNTGSVVLYVSAHADAEALHLGGTRLPLDEVKRLLAELPAAVRLTLLDACRTPVARLKGGRPVATEVPLRLEAPSRVEGTVLLMAAGEGEPAQEWASLRGSLFTHHVLAALRGLADEDEDGAVTLAELYAYAWRHTLAGSTRGGAGAQHPSLDLRLSGWGEWVVARPARLGARLVLGADVEGSLWVTDARREWGMELHKAPGELTRVAVRPGRYRVVRPQGQFAEALDVQVEGHTERVLTRADFLRVPLERARLRGSEPLVPRPWEVGLGYGLASGSVRGLRPEHLGEVLLRYRGSRFAVHTRLGATQARMERELFRLSQTEVRLALGGGVGLSAGPFALVLGVEGQGTWARQVIARVDEEQAGRLFGIEEPPRWGLIWGAGPFASVTCPLGERLRLGVEGGAGLSHVPRAEGAAELRPTAQLHLAASWAL